MKTPRPIKGEKVKWTAPISNETFDVVVHTIKVRSKIAKIIPDYKSENPMPYDYFWVDFNEIGY